MTTNKKRSKRAAADEAQSQGRVRSVRFHPEHEQKIEQKARTLGLSFSKFVRLSSYVAAGGGDSEMRKALGLLEAVKGVSAELVNP